LDGNSGVSESVGRLVRQQAALADFGSFAFRETDLAKILAEAARICADCLGVPFCKICRYRPESKDLLIVAGFGWKPNVVGHVVSRADVTSPQGRAFATGEPVIAEDLRAANSYALPPFYAEHGIVSTIDVLIKGNGRAYGVLEIDSPEQHTYDQRDIDFLTGFANVLAEAVARSQRTEVLRTTVARMKALVRDKDRLLADKLVLAQELQHRVRNNLQVIYGMLTDQLDRGDGDVSMREGARAIARRVMTLANVYDHLLGSGMTREVDAGKYLKSLCASLGRLQPAQQSGIALVCDTEYLALDVDAVTVLGLVVAELVSNSYIHAFPNGTGTITVSLSSDIPADRATLTVVDDGAGFEDKGDDKRHGLGLVRRLIGQIRGTVVLQSDRGVAWTLTLPIASNRASRWSEGTSDAGIRRRG
jgi:two-component sensor histidine kinase